MTVTGPEELVALVAGVLPGGFGELAGEGVGERLEALGVGGGEVDADVVRRDEAAAHAEGAAVVEHADHAVPDLDGLEPAAEGLVERALDQPLEPALEPLESHVTSALGARSRLSFSGRDTRSTVVRSRGRGVCLGRECTGGSCRFRGSVNRACAPLTPNPDELTESGAQPHWYAASPRASGGIGRRGGFRCLCPKGCGGSSPPSPTGLCRSSRTRRLQTRLLPGAWSGGVRLAGSVTLRLRGIARGLLGARNRAVGRVPIATGS